MKLECETFGSPTAPALLLVMGFGAQLIAWPRAFCERLAAGDRFVIRFDNRDCGLSSKLDGQAADVSAIAAAAAAGDLARAQAMSPYTLSDMADDGFALLTSLGIDQAHVVGSSMGGAIAQTMAIEHPERVLSLTSMMSATGEPEFGQSTPQAMSPYTLSDMADDGFALLTSLGIDEAHVVGSSMGGAIAQTMAIEHPERVLSLTSMMSATGEPEFGQSTPQALEALLTPPPSDRDGYVLAATNNAMVWASKKYRDPAAARELAAQSYDRSYYPEGVARQLAALIASGSRAGGLRDLGVPTLVIHGLDDTLVTPSGGERTAHLVPNARLLLLPDMGHDRPPQLWPQICAAILEHTTAEL